MDTRSGARIVHFGPFSLDSDRRRLHRGLDPVRLPDRQLEILLALVARPGHVVSKDALIERAWHGSAVADSSLTQAVKELRKVLGNQCDGTSFIENAPRLGYRFAADVSLEPPSTIKYDSGIDPYLAFVEGRAALETLDRTAIARASEAFSAALQLKPDFAAAHIGIANALFLDFEATRADVMPNRAALEQAEAHARKACRLAPESSDAWGSLAVVLHRRGDISQAVAAARKAVDLEPGEWRHHVRLAVVSWGGERLRAATRILTLCPNLALGHWFAASVFVARGAFDAALDHLRAGCAIQNAHESRTSDQRRFSTVGLHLLHGLVLATSDGSDCLDAAYDELSRELASAGANHIYARECRAHAWSAIGALRLRQERDDAAQAFESAIAEVPGYALASVGLIAAAGDVSKTPDLGARLHSPNGIDRVDAAIVEAAVLTLRGRHDLAALVCSEALARAGEGAAGWLIPVEPLLNVGAHADSWRHALAVLHDRAA